MDNFGHSFLDSFGVAQAPKLLVSWKFRDPSNQNGNFHVTLLGNLPVKLAQVTCQKRLIASTLNSLEGLDVDFSQASLIAFMSRIQDSTDSQNQNSCVYQDHDMTIDLGKLPQFLEEWQEKLPALLTGRGVREDEGIALETAIQVQKCAQMLT